MDFVIGFDFTVDFNNKKENQGTLNFATMFLFLLNKHHSVNFNV